MKIINSSEYVQKYTKGVRMLVTIWTNKEGFCKACKKGGTPSKSYETFNPGNIGNTDDGSTNKLTNFEDGVERLIKYFIDAATGKKWSFGYKKIPPFWSIDVHRNPSNYGRTNGYLPGYEGQYNGEIGYFTKKYATGARVSNTGISGIVTLFSLNSYTGELNGNTKLIDLVNFNPPDKKIIYNVK